MKKEIKLLLLVCTAFAALAACRPTVDFTPVDSSDGKKDGHTYLTTSDSYADIFKAFWEGMDTNYVYWDVEPTGYWDEVWNKYKPLFDALGDYNVADTSQEAQVKITTARTYLVEMVKPLKDGHLAVYFEYYDPRDNSPYNPQHLNPSYSPADAKVDARFESAPDNTNPVDIFSYKARLPVNDLHNALEGVFGKSLLWAATPIMATGEISAADTLGYTGPGHIRYLYFDAFDITAMKAQTDVAAVMSEYIGDLSDPHCRGVIFDLRGNMGGANVDIALLLNPLLTSDLTFAHTRLKKSAGRLDYMPWAPYTLKANPVGPSQAANAGAMPVVAIVNDYSISCGEIMPAAIKAMPKGRIIGTRTWGATGPRNGDETPTWTHGGSFTHNKLWTQVVQAGYQTRGLHFENYEGVGIKPDEVVPFDRDDFLSGTDAQLQAAIRYVESQQ